ncbi:MAG: glutathione peroxidase [Xanthomonadales bacterium]|nr:glutathione peroxidase [Xanthomonadales bacterium]
MSFLRSTFLVFFAAGAIGLAALALADDSDPSICQAPLLDVEFRPLAEPEPVNLCQRFQGQVLLVVNTASKCGFTPQYEGLEALHARLNERGFSVLGFPANDFLGQEPGTEEEIREFCINTFGVQFPMFEKIVVTGDEVTPFYQALAAQSDGELPGWNFHKYLVDRSGEVVGSFGSRVTPDDPRLLAAIEQALAAPAGVDGAVDGGG